MLTKLNKYFQLDFLVLSKCRTSNNLAVFNNESKRKTIECEYDGVVWFKISLI